MKLWKRTWLLLLVVPLSISVPLVSREFSSFCFNNFFYLSLPDISNRDEGSQNMN